MDWVLFVVLAASVGVSGSERAINSTAVPMATEQLCNAAKGKLTQTYRKIEIAQTPNYVLVTDTGHHARADLEIDDTAILGSRQRRVVQVVLRQL